MSIEFHCSQCGRLLRTGDDTAGRMAQCPECGRQTQVPGPEMYPLPSSSPSSGGGGSPVDATGSPNLYQTPPSHGPAPGYPADPSYALKRLSAPAVCLIITAVLGLFFETLYLLDAVFNFGMNAAFHHAFRHKEFMPVNFEVQNAISYSVVGIVMSIVVLFGAVKMKGLENYWLGFTASILSLIPCTSPCCCLGLPFGIWALVVLSDPVVKASFKS